MQKTQSGVRLSSLLMLLVISGLAFTTGSCKTARSSAETTLEQHLKSPGIREVKVDFFHTDPNLPDKAYISATVTHSFAGRDGNFKKEYLGYILSRDGEGWKVEKGSDYTTNEREASTLLAGEKIRRQG
ncbi:MAG TPA: hypothetical protein VLU47_06215 [Blastocatellia bacterium]|nr:hypothetical protein [Blastocatellia bacterium]